MHETIFRRLYNLTNESDKYNDNLENLSKIELQKNESTYKQLIKKLKRH